MKFLEPTYYFDNVYQIDGDFLRDNNIKSIILDVDNTLISNTVETGDDRLYGWIEGLQKSGISLCIVSNGRGRRVKRFNEKLGLPTVFEAGKPSGKGYAEALELMKADKASTVGVGDQLFTDIWGANRCGIRSVLVRPIDCHEQFWIKLKRILELPTLRSLKRRGIIK